MKNNVFNLKIISISNIHVHEEFDKRRAWPLVRQLKQDKLLCNPIIVASMGNNKYLQLDGMNRLSAFKLMKLKSILVQIIDYNDQTTVELASWCHLFQKDEKVFIEKAKTVNDLTVKRGNLNQVGNRYIKEEGSGRLCTVASRRGNVYLIHGNGSLFDKITKLRKLVCLYKNEIIRDALPLAPNSSDVRFLFKEHPNVNMLMVFPTFTRHQIISIVEQGGIFPPGVTRHLIKRRCMDVNVPLTLFTKKKSIAEQNKELDKILLSRRFRLYEESTIYFE